MKGKKADTQFITNFIAESVAKGFVTPEQITKYAQSLVTGIDEEIIAVEQKKKTRSKLLDVIEAFNKSSKDKTEETKKLPMLSFDYLDICQLICSDIESYKQLTIYALPNYTQDSDKVKYSIKQLLEANIIERVENNLIAGNKFNEFKEYHKC